MKIRNRIFYIIATIIWMAVIFYLSSIPDLKSSFSSTIDTILRKIAHMLEFGILYILLYKSLDGIKRSMLTSAVVAVLYAISDEWHQGFVEGRTSAYTDVIIDSIGILIFLTVQKNTLRKK